MKSTAFVKFWSILNESRRRNGLDEVRLGQAHALWLVLHQVQS